MSKKYNYMLDMAFEIETDEKVCWYNIPKSALIAAVLKRVADILQEDTNVGETFSHLHTSEVEEPLNSKAKLYDEIGMPSSGIPVSDCDVVGGMITHVGGIAVDWTYHTTDDYLELDETDE